MGNYNFKSKNNKILFVPNITKNYNGNAKPAENSFKLK